MAEAGHPSRVFVHVGAPKTGTTFLQEVLWKNRKALGEVASRERFGQPLA